MCWVKLRVICPLMPVVQVRIFKCHENISEIKRHKHLEHQKSMC